MKLTIDVTKEATFGNTIDIIVSGVEFQVELTNIPEDRQWKIDDLRRERDDANATISDLREILDRTDSTIKDLRLNNTAKVYKIPAIKKVREMTNLSLKDSANLVYAVLSCTTPVSPFVD